MRPSQQIEKVTESGSAHRPAISPGQTTRNARLLIVEDHDVNQILVRAMTERLGYETELATDGVEAVTMIRQSIAAKLPFDLVLMDIQLPELDGYEATRMIRSSGISSEILPIIAITASAFRDDVERCLASGMQGHIPKPIQISELQSILEKWLNSDTVQENDSALIEGQNHLSGELTDRYRLRKQEAIEQVRSFIKRDISSSTDIRDLSEILHKLSGTAAIFGDKEFGELAKQLEHDLQITTHPTTILPRLKRFLELE